MAEFQFTQPAAEKTFLVAVNVRGSNPLFSVEDSLKELALLAHTAGMDVVGQASQTLQRIDPATFAGSGKIEEIREAVEAADAQVVVFDDELSPRHQRELEKRFGASVKLLDRSALILDIFAQHAQTREGALQVELAQYEYRLPRLTRQWTHLARQAGGSGMKSGVGLRGPGETQLEVDRREIGRRIAKLKYEIEQVRMHRSRYRRQRTKAGIPVVALVGYTNAGKSTLLRALAADDDIFVADQLFATLDPTTRRVELPSGRLALLTDTVGFIQKLPTTLIAAFRATLEEITEADLLLHVVDVNHPNVAQQIEVVEDTLAEIDAPSIPRILVWNKADLWNSSAPPDLRLEAEPYAAQVLISAQSGMGIDQLASTVEQTLAASMPRASLLIPHARGELVALLYEGAMVEKIEHTNEGVLVRAQLRLEMYERLKDFRVAE